MFFDLRKGAHARAGKSQAAIVTVNEVIMNVNMSCQRSCRKSSAGPIVVVKVLMPLVELVAMAVAEAVLAAALGLLLTYTL